MALFELTQSEAKALLAVPRSGGVTLPSIVVTLHLMPSDVQRLADSLVAKNLLQRRDGSDELQLTAIGLQVRSVVENQIASGGAWVSLTDVLLFPVRVLASPLVGLANLLFGSGAAELRVAIVPDDNLGTQDAEKMTPVTAADVVQRNS